MQIVLTKEEFLDYVEYLSTKDINITISTPDPPKEGLDRLLGDVMSEQPSKERSDTKAITQFPSSTFTPPNTTRFPKITYYKWSESDDRIIESILCKSDTSVEKTFSYLYSRFSGEFSCTALKAYLRRKHRYTVKDDRLVPL